ncbi:MerR family transcriptional regulator [Pseudonocardia sp. TRM90224]|uniref:MerR family transcriptional regulator n=1 Tax=Pseudonocardia sp. TRM90224 TaxID=2812678 RepID=UPI001E4D0C5B|nr:MerR family transcriptional regulator [Pseudonocardia sp. TRM90224]
MTATVDGNAAIDRLRMQNAAVPEAGATLTIADIAERTGVTAHTLRYYERIGLLDVERDGAGHRVYGPAEYRRVVFLNRMRMTGMPIRELQRYVALVREGEQTMPERLALMLAHREAVRRQLAELTFALETIDFKITAYGGDCPV